MEFWDLSLRISEKCLCGQYTLALIFEISTWFVWEVSLANKFFGMSKKVLFNGYNEFYSFPGILGIAQIGMEIFDSHNSYYFFLKRVD